MFEPVLFLKSFLALKLEMLKNPKEFGMVFTRWVTDVDWRLLFLILTPLSLVAFFSVSTVPTIPLSTFAPLQSFIVGRTFQQPHNHTNDWIGKGSILPSTGVVDVNESAETRRWRKMKEELEKSRMAVCLVGGARRFEITGPSIVEKILKEYPNADLFLNSPLDKNSFKLSYLKTAPKLAGIKIFEPKPIPETESQLRVLTAMNSPNGIQGLLQYFNLVEGCLTMIRAYQKRNNFTYDWIVRTRVDGYWNAPLHPENFVAGHYVVPPGSSYGGLNDRLGIGNLNTSTVALSRLALVPQLDSSGFRQLNSESAFKAQLTTAGVPFLQKRLPFCIVTDRQYKFPPTGFGVPVAAMSSPGPLSGAKCRPCTPVCEGECVSEVMSSLDREWSWTNWENGTLALCDAHGNWAKGWEKIYRKLAGEKMAAARKRIQKMKLRECSDDMNEMKRRSGTWEAPAVEEICRLGLGLEIDHQ